jgi:hypothetical protein
MKLAIAPAFWSFLLTTALGVKAVANIRDTEQNYPFTEDEKKKLCSHLNVRVDSYCSA